MALIISMFILLCPLHAENSNSNCAVTIQQRPIHQKTVKKLTHIGIELIFRTSLPLSQPISKTSELNKKEILFIEDFHRKKGAFLKWLKLYLLRPSQLISIDGIKEPDEQAL